GADRRETGELGLDVLDLERDVVHAGTAPRQELADRRLGPMRREQLDAAPADTEEGDVRALVGQRLSVLDLGAEQPGVRLDRLLEIPNRDPDVMDTGDRHAVYASAFSARTTPTASDARDSGSTSPKIASSSSRESVSFSSSAFATRSRSARCFVIRRIASP